MTLVTVSPMVHMVAPVFLMVLTVVESHNAMAQRVVVALPSTNFVATGERGAVVVTSTVQVLV